MGVTLRCVKANQSVDLGCGGFLNLRNRVARLVGEPFASHYVERLGELMSEFFSSTEEREAAFAAFDEKTVELIDQGAVGAKVASFLLQPDCEGRIRYGACKELLKVIGDYDDNIIYGYAGWPNPAMFKDFKGLLQACVDNKCDLRWY